VSGFWLGLTMGRFLIGPLAARIGWTPVGLTFACLTGTAGVTLLLWLVPAAGAASAGLVVLGFCLGPIFPTTVALAPSLTTPHLVATAIGVINGICVVGGAVLPWLAGVLIQSSGVWTVLPFLVGLALVQLLLWRLITARVVVAVDAEPAA
jgi:fucose permease